MASTLTACRSCGSTEFNVHESYWLSGEIDADHPGVIIVSGHADGGADHVQCTHCGATPDGYELEFC